MVAFAKNDDRGINQDFHTVRATCLVFTKLNLVFPGSFHASTMVHAINALPVLAF